MFLWESFGRGKCKTGEKGKGKLDGFFTPLYPHQLMGVAWMIMQELNPARNSPKGGILADEMGLGKTLQVLALISQHKKGQHANAKNDKSKGTLIVVPAAALDQWEAEVKRHFMPKQTKSVEYMVWGSNSGKVNLERVMKKCEIV
jgi:SNF2 family DNA or RNA helicase